MPFLLCMGLAACGGGGGEPATTGAMQVTPVAASIQAAVVANGTWAPAVSMTATRYARTATLLPNGKVLVAGGVSSSGPTTASAELYSSDSVTATVLAASANPAQLNAPVTLTATVSPAPSGGTVRFSDNGTAIASCQSVSVASSSASCTVSFTTTGGHAIVATYSGVSGFTSSVSPGLSEVVSSTSCPTLAGCNLAGSNLNGANLSAANLTGSNLKSLSATGANLTNANLTGANLPAANLTGANLTGANLSSANLNGANLTGANLSGAITTNANFNKVIWSNTTCPDGTNSNSNGQTCVGHL